jgi:hypothetical protein
MLFHNIKSTPYQLFGAYMNKIEIIEKTDIKHTHCSDKFIKYNDPSKITTLFFPLLTTSNYFYGYHMEINIT